MICNHPNSFKFHYFFNDRMIPCNNVNKAVLLLFQFPSQLMMLGISLTRYILSALDKASPGNALY